MDYKTTLNLPKTDFPMKADLAKKEPETLKKWIETSLYEKIIEAGKTAKDTPFTTARPTRTATST